MDDIDRKIINQLLQDARTPLTRIAEELGVATATVHQRFRRLQERGVIRGTRVALDWEQAGLPVSALVSVGAGSEGSLGTLAEGFEALPFVQGCYAVTGEFDLLLTVRARSSSHLGEILEDIRRLAPGTSRTVVVLTTYFDGRIPPLEA